MQIGACNLEHHGDLGVEAHLTRHRVIPTYIDVQPIHPGWQPLLSSRSTGVPVTAIGVRRPGANQLPLRPMALVHSHRNRSRGAPTRSIQHMCRQAHCTALRIRGTIDDQP